MDSRGCALGLVFSAIYDKCLSVRVILLIFKVCVNLSSKPAKEVIKDSRASAESIDALIFGRGTLCSGDLSPLWDWGITSWNLILWIGIINYSAVPESLLESLLIYGLSCG